MITSGAKPKATSYEYGRAYQLHQAEKFRQRQSNRWRIRIALAFELFDRFVLPRLSREPRGTVVVDVGCSVGTFAIEFSKRGFQAFGVDFDPAAIEIATELSREERASARFVCQDVSDFSQTQGKTIDVAVCFDIFEHLHDDELGSLLQSLKRNLSAGGHLIFHTYPSQYGYIFQNGGLRLPLIPLAWLGAGLFSRLARSYAAALDGAWILARGASHRESIKLDGHCNLLTVERVGDILRRSGFEIVSLESANLYGLSPAAGRIFSRQPLAHQNIYGVARLNG